MEGFRKFSARIERYPRDVFDPLSRCGKRHAPSHSDCARRNGRSPLCRVGPQTWNTGMKGNTETVWVAPLCGYLCSSSSGDARVHSRGFARRVKNMRSAAETQALFRLSAPQTSNAPNLSSSKSHLHVPNKGADRSFAV
jgi:hypothetical protein